MEPEEKAEIRIDYDSFEDKNRQTLIKSLQLGIEEKNIQIKDLKGKLENLKKKLKETKLIINQEKSVSVVQEDEGDKTTIEKIGSNISQIKEKLMEDEQIVFNEFPQILNLESGE